MGEAKRRKARYGKLYGTPMCPGALESPIDGWKAQAEWARQHQKDVHRLRMRRKGGGA